MEHPRGTGGYSIATRILSKFIFSGFIRMSALKSGLTFKHDWSNTMGEPALKAEEQTGGVSGERLRSFIDRIERLEEDKAAVGEDLKEVYAEAKGVGFDTKIIRQIVRLRKVELEKRRENEELLDLYKAAIGMEE